MKRLALVAACMLLAPVGVGAQVEVGIEAGLQLDNQSGFDDVTQFTVPSTTARIGFPGTGAWFETLLSLHVIHQSGETYSLLGLTPGLNLPLGDGGAYLRAEGAMLLTSGGSDTNTEFGAGGAFGVRKPIDDGPVSFRFELGYDRFFDAEVNRFRALLGLSVVIGGS
jgi:hypothetical protein